VLVHELFDRWRRHAGVSDDRRPRSRVQESGRASGEVATVATLSTRGYGFA
jgi:hypothetical protein